VVDSFKTALAENKESAEKAQENLTENTSDSATKGEGPENSDSAKEGVKKDFEPATDETTTPSGDSSSEQPENTGETSIQETPSEEDMENEGYPEDPYDPNNDEELG
jgi:hypothetical protein